MDMAPSSFLYSHPRKRRSTPTSPESPPDNVDTASSTLDSPEAPSSPPPNTEKQATEHQQPSSRFCVPSFAETSLDLSFDLSLTISSRFSDEHKRHKPSSPPERQRPSTSAASGPERERYGRYFTAASSSESSRSILTSEEKWLVERQRQPSSPGELLASHNRPVKIWREHVSNDNLPTSTHSHKSQEAAFYIGREDQWNISTSSLMAEKGGAEDAASQKVSSSRFGKSKLNLLNPLHLLGRRRASQNHSKPDEIVSTASLAIPAMPDDYDPRIRGKIVHDFSIPRPRRIQSYQGHSAENSPLNEHRPFENIGRRASDLPGLVDSLAKPSVPVPQHSPIFKEHFNDDRQALQPGNKGYLQSLAAASTLHGDSRHNNLPIFAKKLPMTFPDDDGSKMQDYSAPPPDMESVIAIPPPTEPPEAQPSTHNQVLSRIAHPTRPPPPPPVPETSPLKDQKREYVPKHMASTSSRFSFQLGGVDSAAQERLLEEKHKQQAALKKPVDEPDVDEDTQDGCYDDYIPDSDDDLEEKIPGINADLEETDEDEEETARIGVVRTERTGKADSFHFTPASTILSPTTTNATSQPTPRDEMGQVIGFANTTDSPNMSHHFLPDQVGSNVVAAAFGMLNGLGISAFDEAGQSGGPNTLPPVSCKSDSFDDDMYFDDGNFDDVGVEDDAEGFDEAIFDDEDGPFLDIPARNAKNLEVAQQRVPSDLQGMPSYDGAFPASDGTSNMPPEGKQVSFAESAVDVSSNQALSHPELPYGAPGGSVPSQRGGLTEGNLAAYHDALVLAANEAAANGRFSRQTSTSQPSEGQGTSPEMPENQAGLVSDDHLGIEQDETFLFDDDIDDDPMIAEANAEVLENDEEGYYGQEFGFYPRALGKGTAEAVNGGYFGPRGGDGIKRSHSGKANYQEPSLTPITERSEWSARNSVASLPFGPYSAQSVPSPNIAHRREPDSATFDDDDMTFDALFKLRRGAWGGSSTSVNSMGGSHNSNSSLTHLGSRDFGGSPTHLGNGHKITSSGHSLTNSVGIPEFKEEGENEEPEVLTMMQNTPQNGSSDPQDAHPLQDHKAQSAAAATQGKGNNQARGHSRTSSGAESISYIKDPEGSGRWVLERRRTGDDGEFEIVEREYLAGTRI